MSRRDSRRCAILIAALAALCPGCFRLGFQSHPDAGSTGLEPRASDARADRAREGTTPDTSLFDRSHLELRPDVARDAPADRQPDRAKAEGLVLVDQPLGKKDATPDKSKPKDLPPQPLKDLSKDLLPKDLLSKDLSFKDVLPKPPDLKKIEAGFNPNGTYTITPQVTYKCALSVVNFTIDWATFVDNGSTLMVSTGPTGPKGGCSVLTGDTAFDGSFTAACTYAGSCNEHYALTGSFSGNNWSGTYIATYTGSCLNRTNQTWTVTGNRQ